MKTFEAQHKKGYYKDTDAWLDAVYRNNKSIMDEGLYKKGKPKAVFKQAVKEYMDEGMTAKQAVSALARSTIFTPKEERLSENAIKGLIGDKDAYKVFREITKERGKYTKIDRSQLVWDKKEKAYIYNGNVRISFENSPKITIVRLINEQNG